jgi:hypothetical protein
VTNGAGRLAGAVVLFLDGPNVNKASITNSNGEYRFENLTIGNANLAARADGLNEERRGLHVDGTNTLDFSLFFRRTGEANLTFNIPAYVQRVRIVAVSKGTVCSNFQIRHSDVWIVNELLGPCAFSNLATGRYEGLHSIFPGKSLQIASIVAGSLTWTVTEER